MRAKAVLAAVAALLCVGLLWVGLLAPAAAAQQRVIGRYENYTVVEVPPSEPGGDRYVYFVEDQPAGLLDRIRPRDTGIEGWAFAAVWALVALAGLAVARRSRLEAILR